ncbi:TcaA NTF2-like domain-containing protein [Virgibacillus doumboii]|uniref:TcaA NTF2-like domain-containing protein n=1 Tax=Virgibacillus doumboii TaxID=2697503 RepID=UPI0013DFEA30|nr:zinc ribbon domain-containing protein [Virgibacillus doumboii]
MNYCTECGNPLKVHHQFCINCGAKQVLLDQSQSEQSPNEPSHLNETHAENSATEQPSNNQVPSGQQEQTRSSVKQAAAATNRKPMKKSTKIIIASAASLFVLLFGVHLGLSSYFDPMKDLKAMDQAIASGNVNEFMGYIDFDNEALLNKQEYFQYIKEYEWESAKRQYNEIIQAEDPLTGNIRNIDGNPLFTVQPQEHLFGLYTTYKLSAEPATLTLNTTMDKTEVRIGDASKTINADAPIEFSLYPGTYEINGIASNMYGEFTYEDSIEIRTKEEGELNLEFRGRTYSLSSNQSEAVLFVDGEDTGLKLREIDSLGPFPEDSNITMHAEWTAPNGDVIKSETVTQNDSRLFGGIPFTFDQTEIREAIESQVASSETSGSDAGDTVLAFRDAYEKALNQKDFSLIESFMKKGSDAEDGLKEYIGDLKDTDYNYDFTSNEVLDVEEVDDKTVKVTTNEKFTFTNHQDEQIDYDREKTYTVSMVDEEYKISLIEYDDTNRDKQ